MGQNCEQMLEGLDENQARNRGVEVHAFILSAGLY